MAGTYYALLRLQRISLCSLLALLAFCAQTTLAQEAHTSYQHLLSLFTQREYGQVISNVEQLRLHTPITLQELQSIYLAAESYYAIGNYQKSKEYTEYWLANCAAADAETIKQLTPYCKFRLAQLHSRLDDNQKSQQLLKQLLTERLPRSLEASASLQLAWLCAEEDSSSAEAKSLCDKCLSLSKHNSLDHLSAMLLEAVLSRNAEGNQKARQTLATVRKECGSSQQFQELRYKATVLLLQIENDQDDSTMKGDLVQELKTMQAPNQKLLELAKLESTFAINDTERLDLKIRELMTLGQTAKDLKVRQRAFMALIRTQDSSLSVESIAECCETLLKSEGLAEDTRAEITFRLASALCKTNRAAEGVELLSKCAASLPSDNKWKPPSMLLLAECSFQAEKLAMARETFAKILNDPNLSRSAEVRYLAILRLGEIAAIEKDWPSAEQYASDLRQATDTFTYTAATNYLFGRISVSKGEIDQARSLLAKAVQSAGKETEIAARAQWLIGETYFLQENFTMALQNYAAVLHYEDQPQWCAISQLQAAKCMEANGNLTGAIAAYQKVIDEYPQSIYIDESLDRLKAVQQSVATHVAEADSKSAR